METLYKDIFIIYKVCLKSNETGVIKTLLKNIEIYSSQIP